MNFSELEELIRSTYSDLWPRLFPLWVLRWRWPFILRLRPARITIRKSDSASAHSDALDKIVICVAEGDLGVGGLDQIDDPKVWPMWMTDLVHEMMHEFQKKVRPRVSPIGASLFAKPSNRFDGPGHDEVFYTAIARCSSHFDLTPDEFVRFL